MRRKENFLIIALLWLGLVTPAQAKVLNVVTTTQDLKSVVEYIGGEKVKVHSLGQGQQNYHFLAAKPSYMMKAKKADLFIRVGLELEVGYEPLILEGSRNRNIQVGRLGHLDASEGIVPLDVPQVVDRSMGDIHASGNPHYWLDPLNMKIAADNIAERLSQLSPQDAQSFNRNLQKFVKQIDIKFKNWKKRLAPYRGEKLISYHKTWDYFVHRFGFTIIGELEPKPGVPPSPTHLRKLVKLVEEYNVKIILNENIYKDDAARFVAERTKAKVVVAPISVNGEKGVEDYFSLMDRIVDLVAKGFEQ